MAFPGESSRLLKQLEMKVALTSALEPEDKKKLFYRVFTFHAIVSICCALLAGYLIVQGILSMMALNMQDPLHAATQEMLSSVRKMQQTTESLLKGEAPIEEALMESEGDKGNENAKLLLSATGIAIEADDILFQGLVYFIAGLFLIFILMKYCTILIQ